MANRSLTHEQKKEMKEVEDNVRLQQIEEQGVGHVGHRSTKHTVRLGGKKRKSRKSRRKKRKTRRKARRRKSHKKRKYRTRRRRRKGGDNPAQSLHLNSGPKRLTTEDVVKRNLRHRVKGTHGPSEAQIKNALRRIEKQEHKKKINEYGNVADFRIFG